MTVIHAARALTPEGWRADVRLTIAGGRFVAVETGAAPSPDDERHAIALPGMANVHSHAFQRGMAGLAELRGQSPDSFWTWREWMYRFALTMNPGSGRGGRRPALCRDAGGRLHPRRRVPLSASRRDGRPYAAIAEMAARIAAAAARDRHRPDAAAGVLRPCDFGAAPPTPGQRRFISDLDGFARLLEGCRDVADSSTAPMSASRRIACAPSRPTNSPASARWPGRRRSTSTSPSRSRRSRTASPGPARGRSHGCSTMRRSMRAGACIHATHMNDGRDRRAGQDRRRRRPLPDHRSQSRRRHLQRAGFRRPWRPVRHRHGFERADRRRRRIAPARICAAPRPSRAQCHGGRRRLDGTGACSTARSPAAPRRCKPTPAGSRAGAPANLVTLDAGASGIWRRCEGDRHSRRLDIRRGRASGRLRLGARPKAGRGRQASAARARIGARFRAAMDELRAA